MMAKEFLPLFLDFNETTQDLSDAQCGHLVRSLVDYANGKEPEISDGMELMAFRFLKGSIDRNARLSAVRATAGSSGGFAKAKKQKLANDSKSWQTVASDSKKVNINNDINSKTNNDNDKDKDNDNKFERFWTVYPRHVSKQEAKRKFEKLNPDEELLETMIRAVEVQKESDQWTRDGGQYIPHPSTWIHQRRWEDDVKPISLVSKRVSAQDYAQRDYDGVQDELMAEQDREMESFLNMQKGVG
jgi:hypothetical protein